jgi:hypothetical protein
MARDCGHRYGRLLAVPKRFDGHRPHRHRTVRRRGIRWPFLRHKSGYRSCEADCGAVTLIQRFGRALNLNVHFHMLMPDGVYFRSAKTPVFIRIAPPTRAELQALVERIGANLGKHLERRGILVRDVESSYLALDPDCDEDALPDLQGHSISYRAQPPIHGQSPPCASAHQRSHLTHPAKYYPAPHSLRKIVGLSFLSLRCMGSTFTAARSRGSKRSTPLWISLPTSESMVCEPCRRRSRWRICTPTGRGGTRTQTTASPSGRRSRKPDG